MDRLINLQTATSLISVNPPIYNSIAYLICGALFLVWAVAAFRARLSASGAHLGLAAAAALTMLPVYHRQNDAMLLLLAIPACAMLWTESRQLRRTALALSLAALYITGALPSVVATVFDSFCHLPLGFISQLLATVQLLSAPMILLAMTIFYLWVYVTRIGPSEHENGMPHVSLLRHGKARSLKASAPASTKMGAPSLRSKGGKRKASEHEKKDARRKAK